MYPPWKRKLIGIKLAIIRASQLVVNFWFKHVSVLLINIGLFIAFCVALISGQQDKVLCYLNTQYPLLADHTINSPFLFNLSIGYIVSYLFWLLVVIVPGGTRKRAIKKNMLMRYQYFREDVARNLFNAAQWYLREYDDEYIPYIDQKELAKKEKFKSYFDSENMKLFYAAKNGIQCNDDFEKELLLLLNKFSSDISFFLGSIETRDQDTLDVLFRTQSHISDLSQSFLYTNDPGKYLADYLYEIMYWRSPLTGDRGYDIFEKYIKKA